ncbi:MAG: hypothetical protein OER93_06035 [Thermoleophilia bacterium]|nr:hypothetical protein [Thermoleophilia bacterium]
MRAMVDESSKDRFWRLVDPLLGETDIDRGTLMRFDCLRVGERFAAAPHHGGDGLIVKLPEERVTDLIRSGVAEPFAPAGRVFREWAHVRGDATELWEGLIDEAVAFARG